MYTRAVAQSGGPGTAGPPLPPRDSPPAASPWLALPMALLLLLLLLPVPVDEVVEQERPRGVVVDVGQVEGDLPREAQEAAGRQAGSSTRRNSRGSIDKGGGGVHGLLRPRQRSAGRAVGRWVGGLCLGLQGIRNP